MAGYYKNEVEMPDGAMVFFGQYHVLDGEPRMYTGTSMTVAEMKRDQRIGSLRYCNVGDRIKSDDEVARLRGRAERAEAALKPFAVFLAWIEAAAEVGDMDPITDRSCVTSIHPGGGSHYLWVGDFRRAAEAIAGPDPASAPAIDPANPPLKLHWEQRRMTRCQADEDDCDWEHCPQELDGKEAKGRHCPLDREEGDGHDD
jgi:hypothetical protein